MKYSIAFFLKNKPRAIWQITSPLKTSQKIITDTIKYSLTRPDKTFKFAVFDHDYLDLKERNIMVYFGASTYINKYGEPWGGHIGYHRQWGDYTRSLDNYVFYELTPIIDTEDPK